MQKECKKSCLKVMFQGKLEAIVLTIETSKMQSRFLQTM
jgi:hypothetical protein